MNKITKVNYERHVVFWFNESFYATSISTKNYDCVVTPVENNLVVWYARFEMIWYIMSDMKWFQIERYA